MLSELTQQPDGALVAACREGQTECFDELVRRYFPPLARVAASRLGRRQGAEDVVQETFFCALKSLHRYDSRFSFRTWLWTILLNQCRRHASRSARVPRVHNWTDAVDDNSPRNTEGLLASPHDPAARLHALEQTDLLERMLGELSEPQADALRLRFYGELKFHEIAAATGCSLVTAKTRVRQGLLRLTDLVRQRDQSGNAPTNPLKHTAE